MRNAILWNDLKSYDYDAAENSGCSHRAVFSGVSRNVPRTRHTTKIAWQTESLEQRVTGSDIRPSHFSASPWQLRY